MIPDSWYWIGSMDASEGMGTGSGLCIDLASRMIMAQLALFVAQVTLQQVQFRRRHFGGVTFAHAWSVDSKTERSMASRQTFLRIEAARNIARTSVRLALCSFGFLWKSGYETKRLAVQRLLVHDCLRLIVVWRFWSNWLCFAHEDVPLRQRRGSSSARMSHKDKLCARSTGNLRCREIPLVMIQFSCRA